MKRSCTAFVGIGLVGVMATSGCEGGAGGKDYVTKGEFEALRARYVATHDTMLALWKATDSMNKILEHQVIAGMEAIDTTPPMPKCPPRCLPEIPPLPAPEEP
jgi:hypothetical protein